MVSRHAANTAVRGVHRRHGGAWRRRHTESTGRAQPWVAFVRPARPRPDLQEPSVTPFRTARPATATTVAVCAALVTLTAAAPAPAVARQDASR
ncbi:hypothetical protein PV779_60295, partial [Streptomyces sp. ID01-9D]|nr:hypothetical protein [Streptomyces sp. ID01-9D]